MKNICLISAILLTIMVAIVSFNSNALMNLSLKCLNCSIQTNFQIISISVFLMGILTGILFMYNTISKNKEKNCRYKNKLEKATVGIDESVLKIKVLENKIKTLEIALDKALKKE